MTAWGLPSGKAAARGRGASIPSKGAIVHTIPVAPPVFSHPTGPFHPFIPRGIGARRLVWVYCGRLSHRHAPCVGIVCGVCRGAPPPPPADFVLIRVCPHKRHRPGRATTPLNAAETRPTLATGQIRVPTRRTGPVGSWLEPVRRVAGGRRRLMQGVGCFPPSNTSVEPTCCTQQTRRRAAQPGCASQTIPADGHAPAAAMRVPRPTGTPRSIPKTPISPEFRTFSVSFK